MYRSTAGDPGNRTYNMLIRIYLYFFGLID